MHSAASDPAAPVAGVSEGLRPAPHGPRAVVAGASYQARVGARVGLAELAVPSPRSSHGARWTSEHPGSGRAGDLRRAVIALMYRPRSAPQPAWYSELVGDPPPPGLVADQAMTASVLGVRGLPLASQRLAAEAGTGRAADALGDPSHLDQARLVPIFDLPHDDLPDRPSPLVVVAADRGRQRHSAPTPR